ncbi:CCR4-NOT core subunit cdc39 [Ciborinia camelliae]|nr:CCR4-NOT core subunit cdc39 [Ciborinia camelliae]
MVNSRGGTFTPSPAQTIVTGVSHSPHGSHHSTFSAGASPSTNSPIGTSGVNKIVVAQVYLLLGTIKEDKDRTKWEQQAEQLRKLVDEHGMEVYSKYFSRLVVGNAPQIFPGINRAVLNPGNYQILVNEVHKVAHDVDQAGKIAESIETGNEDIFRDFDLSTFMDHFKLDALEKTILALAFKSGSRSDLKTKADAILSANYQSFVETLSQVNQGQEDLTPTFLATIVDRFIQGHPPNFDRQAQIVLFRAISFRFRDHPEQDIPAPTEVLAALFLMTIITESNELLLYIKRTGSAFTSDEDTCRNHIRHAGDINLNEAQVATALLYTAISRTPTFSPQVLVSSLRKEVPAGFSWLQVVQHFDIPDLRISPQQFLALYEAVRPIALEDPAIIPQLLGGAWQNTETQLSFISAYASLSPNELDASTIPKLRPSFTLEDYVDAKPEIRERAEWAVRHPLVSVITLTSVFIVALREPQYSETVEAKRLFQEVVVPNLDIFLVSAFGVPRPWPDLAVETINNLFERFLFKVDSNYDFVLASLWRKDKSWVAQRLMDAHVKAPLELPLVLEHAVKHEWLHELASMLNGFGLDLAALAHSRSLLDLKDWKATNLPREEELGAALLTFLSIKAQHELAYQRTQREHSIMLPVKTIFAMLNVLEEILPKEPSTQLIAVQRTCITAYPRLINYGQDDELDRIIDSNGLVTNMLSEDAQLTMEQHYKQMYSAELRVREIVDALAGYKSARDPHQQDVFACMIHGLFDEYSLYSTYPLEALATTAVLFGGIIQDKLIADLPLEIGLGMILEAVRDHLSQESMYKFGLQALLQFIPRLSEWPGFCHQLLQVSGLEGTEPWKKAQNVIHDQQEDMLRNGHNDLMNGGGIINGNIDEMLATEPAAPPFNSVNVDPLPPNTDFKDPEGGTREKVLFLLNNITELNIESKFVELKNALGDTSQKWLAGHLVEERVKLQPNYHALYLGLVKLFEDKVLWNQLMRETFISVSKLLNSESTLQSAVERSYLKNLGGWLGSITLAHDKPIKHRNIAFKQLLLEAYDTQRLMIVIPFVCKILMEGRNSVVFKPPNPWLMDIIHLLIELYHNAELKLNLKFEIEVLCKGLSLDHKSIKPSTEFQSRIPPVEEATEPMAVPDGLDRFENLSVNGLGGGIASGRFSPQEILATMPDLGPLLTYPPSNDMVNTRQLHDILKTAITRAVHEIISPVVERSVTIAAISTAQMIHKDFATEPNEARVRSAAINMVKKTAGSLALVTSKEPLRASMTNYIRTLSIEHQLPEGTIIMCVNSNLDLACSQVEKKAEERAVPEIEEMLEPELEARRLHHMRRPDDPYIDPQLSRWAWTIPSPYKLQPSLSGLNQEQMAIYDEFARQPRLLPITDRGSVAGSLAGTTHVATASDATRSITNDLLQDQFPAVPNLPTPAETPAMPLVNNQQASYSQPSAVSNGRMPNMAMNPQGLPEKVQRLLTDLQQTTADIPEQHYMDLPRPHPVIEILDALYSLIIRSQQGQEPYDIWIAEQICGIVFSGSENTLVIECLVHVLENIIRIGGRCAVRVSMIIGQQVGEALLHVPLIVALVKAEMIDWARVDFATSTALAERKEGTLEFFLSLLEQVFLNDRPLALYTDVAKSLEVAFEWISKEPTLEVGQQLKEKLAASALPKSVGRSQDDRLTFRQDQMEYVFEEWIHLFSNPIAPERAGLVFISHMYNRQLINDKEDLCLFLRLSIDTSVERFEQQIQMHGYLNDAYVPIDALAKLISLLVKGYEREGEVKADKAAFLESILSVITLVLNHHHVMRGESFNQKVFTRLFSSILYHFNTFSVELPATENRQIILTFAEKLIKLQPAYFPGFVYGWMTLISHRFFLVPLMGLSDDMGWQPFAKLMECLLSYMGELVKPLQLSLATRDIYQGVLKFFVILQHDYPDFLAAHSSKLCANIPIHCVQLLNVIHNAHPTMPKSPDPLQQGLKIDRIDEIRISPEVVNDIEGTLQSTGLFEILEQALQNGPSEDAVAHITHTIQRKQAEVTGPGFVPINVDLQLIESLVLHIAMHAVTRARQKGGPTFVRSSTDASLVSMLVHELNQEARHYLLTSMVNQLRFPNSHTHYFMQALLELFGNDLNDQEESDISQQILRVLLERAFISPPIPWGVLVTVIELVKNEKYKFFELPYIKSTPEVRHMVL